VKKQNTGSAAGRVTPTSTTSQTTLPSNTTTAVNTANGSNSISSSEIATQITNFVDQQQQQQQQITVPQASSTTTSQSIPIPARPPLGLNEADFSDFLGMSVPADVAMSATPATTLNSATTACAIGTTSADMACSLDDSSAVAVAGTSVGAEKKKPSRCCVDTCKRKVGLTGFDCRCGGLFCWEHRYSDKHECKFDYKELGQDQIRKNNPVVVGEKIQKI